MNFKNTTLTINPEYDDLLNFGVPSVLVMYEGEIVSSNLSKISFLVPSDAGMYSAGSGPRSQYSVGGSLDVNGPSNITGWKEVSFIPKTNYFVLEYYIPIRGEPDRLIPFDFRTLYPISGMRVVVQEPRRSTNFKVSPEGTAGRDAEGFQVHTYNLPSVTPDQPLLYDITYTKRDTNPSTGGGGSTSSNTTLIIIVIGVIVILAAAFFFLPQFKARPQPVRSRSERRQSARLARKGPGKNKFCPHCGKPVQETDHFCPFCGQSLG